MRKISARKALFFLIAALIVFTDQLAKRFAELYLSEGPIPIFGEVLQFRLAYNDAAAFSLGFGQTWVLSIIGTLAILTLLWFGPKAANITWSVIAGFVLGGAAGNWLDRIFREPSFLNGHVVDFIQIPFGFPIFNVADIFLVVGVCLSIIRVLLGDEIGGHERR